MNHDFFKPLVGIISKHINHQIYDKNVFRIVHQFNNFNPHKDWKQIIDLEIEYLYHKLSPHSHVWKYACKSGKQSIINILISRGAIDWNWGLRGACEGGHQHIVELLIRRGANIWNWGLWGACEGGHQNIVELMIKQGANDWDWGLWWACECGHQSVAQYIISQAKQTGYSIDESIYKLNFNV